ncbi:MAG TPA: glycosyltransferase [Opitutaceae bacterium]
MSSCAKVTAVVAAYRRPELLARLLSSLETERPALAEVVVVDNGRDLADAVARSPVSARRVVPPKNLGCGGGVALGLREALANPACTHAWILDDDASATPGALAAMLAALKMGRADAVVPLVVDAEGRIAWFPGPLEAATWAAIRAAGATPASVRALGGEVPVPWSWAPWPSLLVTRDAIDRAGYPRDDYWFQGEDLEWTLRLTASGRGVLAPAAVCLHTPPAAQDEKRAYRKQLLMLQNNFFTGGLPHGRRLRRHAAGNVWRTLRAARFTPAAWRDVTLSWWRGAVCGRPAGQAGGDGFRRAWSDAI